MEFLMGLSTKDFALICQDSSAVTQIISLKQDEDKIVQIDSRRMMGVAGEAGDRVQFSEFICANVRLYAARNTTSLNTKSISNYTRNELAVALRKGPYHTNILLAGYDEGQGASLYYMDYLATMHKMNVAGFGYGSYFVLSMFDKLWRPDLTQDEALQLMYKGIEEVKRRFVVAHPHYIIKIVDKDGVRVLANV